MDPIVQGLMKDMAELKLKVDNFQLPEVSRVMNWTPTITQGVSVTYSTSGLYFARYMLWDTWLVFRALLPVTSSGTLNNGIVIGNFPYSARDDGNAGTMRLIDVSVASYIGVLVMASATPTAVAIANNSAGSMGSNSPAMQLVNGDFIDIEGHYEIAL